MKEIVLFGSAIAGLLGRNPYTKPSEEFEKCLKKHDKDLFQRLIFSYESNTKHVVDSHSTFFKDIKKQSYSTQSIKDVSKGHTSVDTTTKPLLDKAKQDLEVVKLQEEELRSEAQKEIDQLTKESPDLIDIVHSNQSLSKKLELISLHRPEAQDIHQRIVNLEKQKESQEFQLEQIQVMQKHATSMMNTSFGIRHENHTLHTFQEQYHLPVETPKNVFKRIVYEDDNLRIILAGKIDGIILEPCVNEKPCLIEIKNRVKGFFSSLVEYEKVQIMTYMFICNVEQCFLIQTLKDSSTDISVDLYTFDEPWFHTFREDIVRFGKRYKEFLHRIDEYKELKTQTQKERFLESLK